MSKVTKKQAEDEMKTKTPKTGGDIVAAAGNKAVAVANDDYSQYAGAGTEEIGMEDMTIPFVRILQALSPQLNEQKPEYIPNAKQGDFVNVATGRLIPRAQGLVVIPCAYQRLYTEWNPRAKGGGIVANLGTDRSRLDQCEIKKGQAPTTPEGTEIVVSGTFFCLMLDEETGKVERVVISMSGTQLTNARKWCNKLKDYTGKKPDGTVFTMPAFYMSYKLTNVQQTNEKGSWFGWVVNPHKITREELPGGPELFKAANAFKEEVLAGRVKAAADDTAQPSEVTEGSEDLM